MSTARKHLPRFYAIVDSHYYPSTRELLDFVQALLVAGVTCLQYRNKTGPSSQILSQARELKRICGSQVLLIMNDRADLCLASDFDGVHLGQDDLNVESARKILGPERVIGLSTHNERQLTAARETSADYVAVGPVFATQSKENPDPCVGLELITQVARRITKPIVAIGGITRENCRSVIEAGAGSVAVIRDLRHLPLESAREFLQLLG